MRAIKRGIACFSLMLAILLGGATVYASSNIYFGGTLPSYQGWAYTGSATKTSSSDIGEVTVTELAHEGVTFYAYASNTGNVGAPTTIYLSSINDTKPLYYDAKYGDGQSMTAKYRNINWMVFQKNCYGYVNFY